MNKLPDYLPNKPTVVGSRGQNLHSGYLNRPQDSGPTQLPGLSSSGGIAGNSGNKKQSGFSNATKNSGYNSNNPNGFKAPSLYKYSGMGSGIGGGMGSGIGGGGIGAGGASPYGLPNY